MSYKPTIPADFDFGRGPTEMDTLVRYRGGEDYSYVSKWSAEEWATGFDCREAIARDPESPNGWAIASDGPFPDWLLEHLQGRLYPESDMPAPCSGGVHTGDIDWWDVSARNPGKLIFGSDYYNAPSSDRLRQAFYVSRDAGAGPILAALVMPTVEAGVFEIEIESLYLASPTKEVLEEVHGILGAPEWVQPESLPHFDHLPGAGLGWVWSDGSWKA